MIGVDDVAHAAATAFEWARRQPDVREVEIFVAANATLLTFTMSGRLLELAGGEAKLPALGLIIGGDVTVTQERIAIASTHLSSVQTDESAAITASVTAMVESHDAKGAGSALATRLDHFTDEAGTEAAQNAIDAIGGVRVPTGTYPGRLGRQPLSDLLNNPILPAPIAPSVYP